MVEPIYFLKPAWCGKTFCRPSAGTGLTARYQSHRLQAVVCHSVERMEAAAERALLTGACRYQSVKSILKNALDQQPLGMPTLPPSPPSPHDNIRGAEYFE